MAGCYGGGYGYGFRPTSPSHERGRRAAAGDARSCAKKGHAAARRSRSRAGRSPRRSGARRGATNLERYSDYANRLPRGRTYVRNGSVVAPRRRARARSRRWSAASELYTRRASQVGRAAGARAGRRSRQRLRRHDRLAGRAAAGHVSTRPSWSGSAGEEAGLFPAPRRSRSSARARTARRCASTSPRCSTASARASTTTPSCSSACARSRRSSCSPARATGRRLAKKGPAAGRTLAAADVASVFGIEMDAPAAPPPKKKAAGGGRKTAAAAERPVRKRRARGAGADAASPKAAPVPVKRKATEAPRTSKGRAPKAGPA